MLLLLRDEVLAGEIITLERLKDYGEDHVQKQQTGVASLTFADDQSSGVGRLLVRYMAAERGSTEWKNAATQLEEAGKHKLGRLAEDRHKLRMAALYVDAVSIHEWNRPSRKVSRGQARDFIRDAVNDYSTPYDQRYSNYSLLNKPILNYSRRCRRGPTAPICRHQSGQRFRRDPYKPHGA